jgi:hypothetical protein
MIQWNPRQWQMLQHGSPRQMLAYQIILDSNLFDILKPFDPAHVGTIGNDIDLPSSDIDIICCADDFSKIITVIQEKFNDEMIQHSIFDSRGVDALSIQISREIPIEIYVENTPVEKQLGYRHFMIGCRVLDLIGTEAHNEIRRLKSEGMKTEPAFVRMLGMAGDPYLSFLRLEEMSDDAVRMLWGAARTQSGSPA